MLVNIYFYIHIHTHTLKYTQYHEFWQTRVRSTCRDVYSSSLWKTTCRKSLSEPQCFHFSFLNFQTCCLFKNICISMTVLCSWFVDTFYTGAVYATAVCFFTSFTLCFLCSGDLSWFFIWRAQNHRAFISNATTRFIWTTETHSNSGNTT